jgi:hypothetical protein
VKLTPGLIAFDPTVEKYSKAVYSNSLELAISQFGNGF